MVMNYFLICYADFIVDQETRNQVGWAMIGVISLNLIVNFGYIIIRAIKEMIYNLRTKFYKWRL